jgi:hypothetical protein
MSLETRPIIEFVLRINICGPQCLLRLSHLPLETIGIKTDYIIGGHRCHLPFFDHLMSACYPDRVRFRRISGQYQVYSTNIFPAKRLVILFH